MHKIDAPQHSWKGILAIGKKKASQFVSKHTRHADTTLLRQPLQGKKGSLDAFLLSPPPRKSYLILSRKFQLTLSSCLSSLISFRNLYTSP